MLGLRDIYNRLVDEESRKIFEARLDFVFDSDLDVFIQKVKPYLHNIKSEEVDKAIKVSKSEGIIVFGCGHDGLLTKEILEICGYKVDFFCDSNRDKLGLNLEGIPILSIDELVLNYKDYLVIIGSRKYLLEIYHILESVYFPMDHVLKPKYDLIVGINESQYFDVFPAAKDEIFVDAGSYNGDTTIEFMNWCHNSYKRIFVFEPLKKQYEIITERCKEEKWRDVEIYNYAVWSKEQNLCFEDIDSGSRVRTEGKLMVNGNSLDNVIKDKVSFLKMDIEGSELDALDGAKKLICKYRPKLAICLYHKPEDIFEIPKKIIDLVPEYKFYIRHYSTNNWETVLYGYFKSPLS